MVSSAWSFVIVLVAFHEVHTPTQQFNFLNFILECGGAGNLAMLAAKTRLRVAFPSEVGKHLFGEGCGPCQHPPGGINLNLYKCLLLVFGDENGGTSQIEA